MSQQFLVTVKGVHLNNGIKPIPYKPSNPASATQIKTLYLIRKVLEERPRSFCKPPSFTPTLTPIVEGNEEVAKIQKVAEKGSIIAKPLKHSFKVKRTESGDLSAMAKKYWEKAGPDPFSILNENRENLSPNISSMTRKDIEKLNETRVGGFWERSERS